MGFKNKACGKILSGPNPVCPQRGPYEASEGIYPVIGNGKKWERARIFGSNNGCLVNFEFSYCFPTISKILAAEEVVFQLCLIPAGMK